MKTRQKHVLGVLSTIPLFLLSVAAQADFVNCDHGQSLSRAIDRLRPGDTLIVRGTCNENVVITEEIVNVTLDGRGTATINGPDADKNTITVRGRGIRIKQFTITGGDRGIATQDGGTAVIEENIIKNAATFGIHAGRNSAARVLNNTITDNGGAGMNVRLGSGADIFDNSFTRNGRGIDVDSGGAADISGNHVFGNHQDGILVRNNAHVRFSNDPNNTRTNVIEQNGRFGVSCIRGGSISGNPVDFGAGNGAGNRSIDASCLVETGVLP